MGKSRLARVFLFIVFFAVIFLNLFIVVFSSSLFDYSFIAGNLANSGAISLFIMPEFYFYIHSPIDNESYEFNASDANLVDGNYEFMLDLKVSSPNEVIEWNYSLSSLFFGEYSQAIFSPNITMDVRLGNNTVSVGAKDDHGSTLVRSANFLVNVENSSPVIDMEQDSFFACEGSDFSHRFNFSDLDCDESHSVTVVPQDPFYGSGVSITSPGVFWTSISTYDFDLDESDIGVHNISVYVSDSEHSDSVNVSINVLDVNLAPFVSDHGAAVVWNNGADTWFNRTWIVSDVEDGSLSDGVLNISLTYQNGSSFDLFNISPLGEVSYDAFNETRLGSYPLKVCVEDSELTDHHENLSKHCEEGWESNEVCDSFTLSITDSNRAPNIDAYYPDNFSFEQKSGREIYFNVSASDFDENAVDIDWYVSGEMVEHNEYGPSADYSYFDSFEYFFPCRVGFFQNVTVNVTDGEMYDSHTWELNLTSQHCYTDSPEDEGGGGGGGGGGGKVHLPFCVENWSCPRFGRCHSVLDYYDEGKIDDGMFDKYIEKCQQMGLSNVLCGIKTKECVDLNHCEEEMNDSKYIVESDKPDKLTEVCHYVSDPSCYDGVKNCHGGSCEVLVDCGGPCEPCPSCDDGIMNQGEEGVDCGGPCMDRCIEEPSGVNFVLVVLLAFITIMTLLIIYFAYRLFFVAYSKKLGYESRRKSPYDEKRRSENIKKLFSNR